MNKQIFILVALCGTILFSNCKKEDTPVDPGPTKDYLPSTAGSTFTYKSVSGGGTNTYTLTVTANDTSSNSKTYKILTSTDGVNRYRAKIDNNYYQLAAFDGLNIPSFEDLYLKDNAAVNDTWNGAATFPSPLDPTQTINAKLVYTIMEKGISKTVEGKSYSDVIHVKLGLSISATIPPIPVPINIDLGGGNYYYSLGVGLIKSELNISSSNPLVTFPPFNLTETLTAYLIK